ncbi:MAG: DMT family transporter, partial [Xanthomonadales bacterium]|nr:DMT family transporter [Xanthomonadales bacterium]
MGWGEFFALASAVIWAFAVILLRRSGETLPAFELNLVKNTLGALLLVPTIAVFSVRAWPGYPPVEVATLLLSGFLGIAVADTWYLKALNLVGASRTGIVASLYSPFVVVLSAVFLSDVLNGWQWLGFGTVLAGVLLVTWRRARTEV